MFTEDANVEFLIQNLPLSDVLAFVNARDDVRYMAVESVSEPPETAPTMRVLELVIDDAPETIRSAGVAA